MGNPYLSLETRRRVTEIIGRRRLATVTQWTMKA